MPHLIPPYAFLTSPGPCHYGMKNMRPALCAGGRVALYEMHYHTSHGVPLFHISTRSGWALSTLYTRRMIDRAPKSRYLSSRAKENQLKTSLFGSYKKLWTREEHIKLAEGLIAGRTTLQLSREFRGRSAEALRKRAQSLKIQYLRFEPSDIQRARLLELESMDYEFSPRRFWTDEEDSLLLELRIGASLPWPIIASKMPTRSQDSCMKRFARLRSNPRRGTPASLWPKLEKKWTRTADDASLALTKASKPVDELAKELPCRDGFSIVQRGTAPRDFVHNPERAEVHRIHRWSRWEDRELLRLREIGVDWDEIPKRLPGRTLLSCKAHYRVLSNDKPSSSQTIYRRWNPEDVDRLIKCYARGQPWPDIIAEFPERTSAACRSFIGRIKQSIDTIYKRPTEKER